MAIQTDTNIVSFSALLAALVAFAVAEAGFTDETDTETVDGEILYKLSRTTSTVLTYWGFVYSPITNSTLDDERVRARMMLSEPTEANWETLAVGQRKFTHFGAYDLAPPYTGYTFYSDGNSVFVILEVRANIFTHMCIGNLEKCGTYDGGEFLQADYHVDAAGGWTGLLTTDRHNLVFCPRSSTISFTGDSRNYVRYDTVAGEHLNFFVVGGTEDNADNISGSATLSPSNSAATFGRGTLSSSLALADYFGNVIFNSPSNTTNVAPIMPCYVTRRDETLNLQRIIGFVPNIGALSIENLNPKDIVNTDWRVFPRGQKTGDVFEAMPSDIWGLAYKEIP